MRTSNYTEWHIIRASKPAGLGTSISNLYRKLDNFWLDTPMDNPLIELSNDNFQDECLDLYWIMSIENVRNKVELWRRNYGEFCPHSAQSYLTPAGFAQNIEN